MDPNALQYTAQAVQQSAQASDNLITIIAGFFLVFTTFIKVLTEICGEENEEEYNAHAHSVSYGR